MTSFFMFVVNKETTYRSVDIEIHSLTSALSQQPYRDWVMTASSGRGRPPYFDFCSASNAAFRLACRIAALMVIFVQLRKRHLPQRDDQASSVKPIDW